MTRSTYMQLSLFSLFALLIIAALTFALGHQKLGAPSDWDRVQAAPAAPVASTERPHVLRAVSPTVGDRAEAAPAACKEYTTTIMIDGMPQLKRGTACRQANGVWKLMN